MTTPLDPDTLTDPRDAAAYWFARERAGQMDETQRARMQAWLGADPQHALEYRRAQGIWNATGRIAPARLRALAAEPPARFLSRRRLTLGLGATAAAVAAGLVLPGMILPSYAATFHCPHGERRQITLPDGSMVELNTDTALDVRFYAGRRTTQLTTGEAAFSVTHDPQRPFYVEAADTQVRVTGTRFDVLYETPNVRVAVEAGAVEVRQGTWWNRHTVVLGAGQTVQTGLQGLGHITEGNVDALLAWREGRIVFADMTLSAAVTQINRYAPHPVVLEDPTLASVRVAGVFSTDHTDAFLDLLPSIAPVRLLRNADGTTRIARR